jgi:hypothetical protein
LPNRELRIREDVERLGETLVLVDRNPRLHTAEG